MDYITIPHLYFEGTRTFIITISEDIAIILQNGDRLIDNNEITVNLKLK